MFTPDYFEITDEDEIFSFIESNSFGQLISNVNGRPFSSHIPFLVSDDRKTLFGHLAKRNPQHEDIEGQEVLVTLQGPHTYISPSWYEAKGVPTWNYQAVHIYGTCVIFAEPEKLRQAVDALTHKNEAAFEKPWLPEYGPAMLNAIIGIEISIQDIQCTYKLNQNRSDQDRNSVIRALETMKEDQISEAMKKTLD